MSSSIRALFFLACSAVLPAGAFAQQDPVWPVPNHTGELVWEATVYWQAMSEGYAPVVVKIADNLGDAPSAWHLPNREEGRKSVAEMASQNPPNVGPGGVIGVVTGPVDPTPFDGTDLALGVAVGAIVGLAAGVALTKMKK